MSAYFCSCNIYTVIVSWGNEWDLDLDLEFGKKGMDYEQ